MANRPRDPKSVVPAQPPEEGETADLAKEVERRIGPLISHQSRDQVVNQVVAMFSEKFSGPIAHPRHLRDYDAVVPGAAERIIKMAENQQNHNMDMERLIVEAQIADQKRGMRYGFAALVLDLAAAIGVGLHGDTVLAGMVLGVGVAGVVIAFIKGRHSE